MDNPINNRTSIWDMVFGKKTVDSELKSDHLHPKANVARGNLEEIFKELGREKELLPHAEAVIHPLLREVDHLQSKLKLKDCPITISKYTEWTEKAAKWVEVYANSDKEGALIHNIVEKSHAHISRDIDLIEKYMEANKLDPLSKAQLEPELIKLSLLQKKPNNLTLKKITSWKSKLNNTRAKIVNSAFHKIDNLIKD